MKLTNQQINAIANKIIEEHYLTVIKPVEDFNAEFKNSDDYKNFYKLNADCIFLDSLAEKIETNYDYCFSNIKGEIKQKYFKNHRKEVPNLLSTERIKDQIHLSLIDSPDLDTILNKLRDTFLK